MRGTIERAARVAYAFVMMNVAAVNGLVAFSVGRRVW
jgi:hypothetical protein